MINIDLGDLTELGDDLTGARVRVIKEVHAVTKKGALKIKNQLRREAEGHPHFPHFPRSITFDITATTEAIEAEIGPDKDKMQGALGNILYFGTGRTGPVLPDPGGALDAEADAFAEHVAKAAAAAVLP